MKTSRAPRAHTRRPESWLFLVSDAGDLEPWVEPARDVAFARHSVAVAHATGEVPKRFPGAGRAHRVPEQRSNMLAVPTRLVERSSRLAASSAWVLSAPVLGPRLARRLHRADHIVLVDPGLEWLVPQAPGLKARIWRGEAGMRALEEESTWRWLVVQAERFAARGSLDNWSAGGLVKRAATLREFDRLEFTPEADVRPALRELARRSVRGGKMPEALALVDAMDLFDPHYPPLPREKAAQRALRTHASIAAGEPAPADLASIVSEVLAAADERFAAGEDDDAYSFAVIGMALLFHQQLHTATEHSPLVDQPADFLAPLHRAEFWTRLVAEEARAPRSAPKTPGQSQPQRVLALPGVYHHHAGPMLRALTAEDDITLKVAHLDLPVFRGMILDTTTLRMRFEALRGETSFAESLEPEAFALVRGSDVIVADWADKGAVWASVLAPRGARLTIRIHSVDVLSGPVHLVDWSAVDTVIAVSPHIRDVFRTVLGDRVKHVDLQVVTNRILTERFTTDKPDSADWTVGVVGWGQHVKDPVLALEVLAALRARDERWQLKFIGADFRQGQAEHINRYSREFMQRALQPDVVDAVHYSGFTRRLPEHLKDVGYILSTSLRESCPVGVLEGVASGAVPVVREWPVFAELNAAAGLFPDRFVFRTAAEAADIIDRSHARRSEVAAEVRTELADLFSEEQTEGRLVATILGRE